MTPHMHNLNHPCRLQPCSQKWLLSIQKRRERAYTISKAAPEKRLLSSLKSHAMPHQVGSTDAMKRSSLSNKRSLHHNLPLAVLLSRNLFHSPTTSQTQCYMYKHTRHTLGTKNRNPLLRWRVTPVKTAKISICCQSISRGNNCFTLRFFADCCPTFSLSPSLLPLTLYNVVSSPCWCSNELWLDKTMNCINWKLM